MSYLSGTESIAVVPRPTPWLYGDRLRAVGIKLFADGALGSRGAWLKAALCRQARHPGAAIPFRSRDARARRHRRRGAASRSRPTPSAMPPTPRSSGSTSNFDRKDPGDRRWRIEHFQIADPADIPRLAPAGIIASMQPTHQTSDRLMAEKRLGASRLAGAYAWQTVLKSGAKLAFGSDFPVESPNPFPGLAAAISRQDMKGQPPGGWIPSRAADLRAGPRRLHPRRGLRRLRRG